MMMMTDISLVVFDHIRQKAHPIKGPKMLVANVILEVTKTASLLTELQGSPVVPTDSILAVNTHTMTDENNEQFTAIFEPNQLHNQTICDRHRSSHTLEKQFLAIS